MMRERIRAVKQKDQWRSFDPTGDIAKYVTRIITMKELNKPVSSNQSIVGNSKYC